MDDYSLSSLSESKNEWCTRLVNLLTPHIIQGLKSIFKEAWDMCKDNRDKYLMTFQTFLSRVPKWNTTIVEEERKRIVSVSGCNYLEELLTCVHVIQLKALSCVRVGQKQKKVDIDIPPLDVFIHKVYTNLARRIYANIYLFEVNIAPMQVQKHNWVLESIVKECILNTVRENVPVENILRAYMDNTEENDVEVVEEIEKVPLTPEEEEALRKQEQATIVKADDINEPEINNTATNEGHKPAISFNDIDNAIDERGNIFDENKPKTEERLERLLAEAHERRKLEEASSADDDDEELLRIGEDVDLKFDDIDVVNNGGGSNLNLNDVMDVEVVAT